MSQPFLLLVLKNGLLTLEWIRVRWRLLKRRSQPRRMNWVGDVYFAVEEFKSGPNSTIPLGGLFGLSFIDPSGLSVVSLLGIGVVLGFFYPPFKKLILVGLNKVRTSFGLGRVLVGLSLLLVSGVAFGADGGVALGAMDGVGLLLSEEMAGAALGVDPPTMAAVNRLIGGSVFFWLGISTFREQLAGALKKIWDLSIKKGGRLSLAG
jgi:hypothetical protein